MESPDYGNLPLLYFLGSKYSCLRGTATWQAAEIVPELCTGLQGDYGGILIRIPRLVNP